MKKVGQVNPDKKRAKNKTGKTPANILVGKNANVAVTFCGNLWSGKLNRMATVLSAMTCREACALRLSKCDKSAATIAKRRGGKTLEMGRGMEEERVQNRYPVTSP